MTLVGERGREGRERENELSIRSKDRTKRERGERDEHFGIPIENYELQERRKQRGERKGRKKGAKKSTLREGEDESPTEEATSRWTSRVSEPSGREEEKASRQFLALCGGKRRNEEETHNRG